MNKQKLFYLRFSVFLGSIVILGSVAYIITQLVLCRQSGICSEVIWQTATAQLAHPLTWLGFGLTMLISGLIYYLLSTQSARLATLSKVAVGSLVVSTSTTLSIASIEIINGGTCAGFFGSPSTCVANFEFAFMVIFIGFGAYIATGAALIMWLVFKYADKHLRD